MENHFTLKSTPHTANNIMMPLAQADLLEYYSIKQVGSSGM
jgi:hypothetical protein